MPSSVSAAETRTKLDAGFSERDISPAIGMERGGGYTKNFHTKLHDPCKVRAAVLDNGSRRVAIICVDALLIRRVLVQAARRRIAELTGIVPEAVLVCATHSHSSGPTGVIYPGDFDHASPEVQSLAYQRSSNAVPQYVQHVENQIVAAVVEANNALAASRFNVGFGHENKVAFNRRFKMANGMTHTNPRPGNPETLGYAGPIDPQVGVIGVWTQRGELAGCIVNYACHAVGSAPVISANYIYYVEQVVRGTFGENCVVVFLTGASGDVTPVDNLAKESGHVADDLQRFVGGRIGAEAVKVLLTQPRADSAALAFDSTLLKIPRRKPRADRVRQAILDVARQPTEIGKNTWILAKEIVLLDALIEKEPIADVEVQAIQIGPVILLSNPAELFCQMGLDMKERSKFPFTFPVTLANDYVGYVPTEEAFGPRGGGYETRLTASSNLRMTAGTEMLETAIEMSTPMAPDPVPSWPPTRPYNKNAWELGAAPPELD